MGKHGEDINILTGTCIFMKIIRMQFNHKFILQSEAERDLINIL